MKVGETGEAFFVFETDGDVPEDLQTSPLSSPISNETADEEAPGVSSVVMQTRPSTLALTISISYRSPTFSTSAHRRQQKAWPAKVSCDEGTQPRAPLVLC